MKPLNRKTSIAVVGLTMALVVGAFPDAASAQIRLIPQIGLYAPLEDLGEVRTATFPDAVDIGKKESTVAFGLGLEFGAPPKTVTFRANGMYATSSDVPFTTVGCDVCDSRSTVSALTATIVFRPLPNLLVVQPYFLAGGGVKRYDFDDDQLRDEGFDVFISDQTKGTGHVGVGVEVTLAGMRLLVELSDYLSSFDLDGSEQDPQSSFDPFVQGDEKFQNDFLLTVGLALGGRGR